MPATLPKQNMVFPVRGLHEGVGYDIQPPGTTSDALNVRGYDAIKNRLRGGRRAGLSKFYDTAINPGYPIQYIQKVIQSVTPASSSLGTEQAVTEDFSSFTTGATHVNWLDRYIPIRTERDTKTLTRSAGATIGCAASPARAVFNSSATFHFLMVPFATTNKIDTTWRSRSIGDAVDDPFNIAVLCRVSPKGDSYIYLRGNSGLAGSSSSWSIFKRLAGQAETTLATASIVMPNALGASTTDLRIIVDASAADGTISATLYWPSQVAVDARWSTGFTITATDTTTQSQTGVGFGVFQSTSANNCLAATYTRYVPISVSPLLTVSKNDTTSPVPGRYFVPAGVKAFQVTPLTTSAVVSTQSGPYSQNTLPAYGSVDTVNKVITGLSSTPSGKVVGFTPIATPESGVQYGVEMKVQTPGVGTATTDKIGPLFRMSEDLRNMLVVEIDTVTSDATTPEEFAIFVTLRFAVLVNGAKTVLDTFTYATNNTDAPSPFVMDSTTWNRWTDDGTTVKLIVNGVTLLSYLPSGSSNWTPTIAAALTGNRVGATTGTNGNTFRFLRLGGSTSTLGGSSAFLLIAANGTVFKLDQGNLSTPSGGAAALTMDNYLIEMQQAYSNVFMVDGVRSKYYSRTLDTILEWSTAVTGGTLPSGARLIALYRGRVVLSGLVSDPSNWFMSKSGDPFDWNYSPTTPSAVQAVAGNNSEAGLVGDIITALIPFSDDALIFGGDHTIYQMTGDPAAGGTIDLISDKTGIAFGRAWTKDPNGTLYFWGSDGIYRMAMGQKPENFSKGRIDVRLRDIDLNQNRIFMEWDAIRATLHAIITPADTSLPVRVIVWESRNDAWWEDEYPASMGPTVVFAYDSPTADDQAFLLGTRDSYIRMVDDSTDSGDDGTEIESRIRYEPFIGQTHDAEVVLNSVLPVLAGSSAGINVDVYTGQSAEDCATAASPRVRRVLAHAGRNHALRQKVRGYAVQLGLSATGLERWAVESMVAGFEQSGMPRQEAKGGS